MKTSLVRTVAPTEAVLSLAEAYAQLRLDTTGSPPTHPDDALIAAAIDAIAADMDAGTGWLGRALAPQTWRLGLKQFPTYCIHIPFPPFIELVSVTYTDTDGNTQTLVEGTDFRIVLGSRTGDDAMLIPMFNADWPTDVRDDFDSIQITFRCGYVTGSPETLNVPEQIKNVVRAVLTETYDTRGVYENSAIRRGEALDRIMWTLTNIRVFNQ